MIRFFDDGMMIGASVAEVLAYFEQIGVQAYVIEETEDVQGFICTSAEEYADHFQFEIIDGVVDDSYWVLWD